MVARGVLVTVSRSGAFPARRAVFERVDELTRVDAATAALSPLLHSADLPPLPAIGRPGADRTRGRAGQPLHAQELELLRRGRGSGVLVQLPRLRFRDVTIGEPADDHALLPRAAPRDHQLVADLQHAVRTSVGAVDVDLAGLARLLRLGTCAEQTRYVEPHVEPHAASIICGPRDTGGTGNGSRPEACATRAGRPASR